GWRRCCAGVAAPCRAVGCGRWRSAAVGRARDVCVGAFRSGGVSREAMWSIIGWDVGMFCFFFQAEDGIRDRNVTGVQTCALPIYSIENITLLRNVSRPGGQWRQALAGAKPVCERIYDKVPIE